MSFGAAFGDLDGDGDLDLVYSNYQEGATVMRNDSDSGHRVVVALRGAHSNRFGVGATVRVESTSGAQVRTLVLSRGVLSSSEPVLHFGLGEDTRIERLVVHWPVGREQSFTDLAANRRYIITEPSDSHPQSGDEVPPAPTQFVEVRGEDVAQGVRAAFADPASLQPLLPMRHDRQGPAIAAGDLNGDGRDDLVIGGTPLGPAQLLIDTGGEKFVGAELGALTPDALLSDGPLLVFDADGDGDNDLLRTRGGSDRPAGAREYQPELFINDGRGDFAPAPDGALPSVPLSVGAVAAADFNKDGTMDVFIGGRIVLGGYPAAPASALLINRGGRFEDVTLQVAAGLKDIGMVTAAVWSDVDADGWPDLIVAMEWGTVSYFHNDGGEKLEDLSRKAGFASAGTGWWTSLATTDFNGDGWPDFVAGNTGLNTPYRADREHPAILFAGDFDGSGGLGLIEAYHEGKRLFPRRSRRDLGAAMPEILRRFPRNDRFARAELAEILGEARLAAARRYSATELRSGVFLSESDGLYRFVPLPRLAQIAPLQGVVAADFDGDGFADICAVQNSAAPTPSVGAFDGGLGVWLRGDGGGNFEAVPAGESGFVVPGFTSAIVLLGSEGDGFTGLAISSLDRPVAIWRISRSSQMETGGTTASDGRR